MPFPSSRAPLRSTPPSQRASVRQQGAEECIPLFCACVRVCVRMCVRVCASVCVKGKYRGL